MTFVCLHEDNRLYIGYIARYILRGFIIYALIRKHPAICFPLHAVYCSMDQTHHGAAGPEWEYCRSLAKSVVKARLDQLYISVYSQDEVGPRAFDVLETVKKGPEAAAQSPVLQYDFIKLKTQLMGPGELAPYDLWFEAYSGAGSVEIPDAQSFRRLLLAITYLGGIPVPYAGDDPSMTYPPLLRFLAKPTGSPEDRPLSERDISPGPADDPNLPSLPSDILPRPRQSSPPRRFRQRLPQPQPPHREHSQQDSQLRTPQRDSPPQEAPNTVLPELEVPLEEPGFEDRAEQNISEGLNRRRGGHDERFHNLYAQIAGINTNRRDVREPEHAYKPPYSRIRLDPHQTYPTGWVLGDSKRILHYLADMPGLGKTYEAVELMVRVTMILSNAIAIENERKNLSSSEDPPLHIHKEEHPLFKINKMCAADTLAKYGFICQCIKNSPLQNVNLDSFAPGYMLVIVPNGIVQQWTDEIKQFLSTTARLPHNNKPINVFNKQDQDQKRTKIKEFFLPKTQNDTGLGNIFVVANTNCLTDTTKAFGYRNVPQLYHQPSIIVWDEMHESKSLDVNPMMVIKGLISLALKPVHVVAMSGTPISNGPEDFNLAEDLAIHKKMGVWYGEDTLAQYIEDLELQKKAFIDLAQEVRNDENLNLAKDGRQLTENDKREAHNLLRRYDQACHRYTDVLPLLQRGSTSDYLGYPLPAYSTAYNRKPQIHRFNTPMGNVQMQVANNYKEYLRLRWQRIVRSWRREPENTRGPKPKFADNLFILDASGGAVQNTFHIDTSLIGFAPGMATEVLKRRDSPNTKKFRSDEVQDIFSSAVTPQRDAVRSSEYWDMVPGAFFQRPGSRELQPKIDRICKIIDQMLQDKDRHKSLPRRAGSLKKKAVICVPHAWQGFILITFLFKKYSKHNFTFVGAGMSAVLRSKLMAPFSRKTDKVYIEDSQEDDPIALISTISFIGSGLNLIRCNYCIATSPLRSRAEESQLFARINRNGQTCNTHNYLLLDDGNPVDVVTYHRMQTRTALTVPLDDRKEGYNFIVDVNDGADEQEPSNVMDVDERLNDDIDNTEPDDGSQDIDNDEEPDEDGAEFEVEYEEEFGEEYEEEFGEEYGIEDGAEDEIDRSRKRQRQQ